MFENTNTQFADSVGWLLYYLFDFFSGILQAYSTLLFYMAMIMVIGVVFAVIVKVIHDTS